MDPENTIINLVCATNRATKQQISNELRAWYAQGGYHPTIYSVYEEACKCGVQNKIRMCRIGYLEDMGVKLK